MYKARFRNIFVTDVAKREVTVALTPFVQPASSKLESIVPPRLAPTHPTVEGAAKIPMKSVLLESAGKA